MRAIFFGTPDFAVPSLVATCESGLEVVLVVCQPDRPAGRGLKLTPPPVKVEATRRGLAVFQPARLRDEGTFARLSALRPDLCIVAAYGRIFPRALLELPPLGCVNVHASLLPALRGAAPIHWAILSGARETGVSIMRMDEGMDAGPVYATVAIPIERAETAGTLHDKLAAAGAGLLARELPRILSRGAAPVAQDHARATQAPKLDPALARLDLSRDAAVIDRTVRGLSPTPGAYATRGGKRVKLLLTRVVEAGGAPASAPISTPAAPLPPSGLPPGTLAVAEDGALLVACGKGWLAIDRLQAEGARPMTAREYLAGHPLSTGERLNAGGPAAAGPGTGTGSGSTALTGSPQSGGAGSASGGGARNARSDGGGMRGIADARAPASRRDPESGAGRGCARGPGLQSGSPAREGAWRSRGGEAVA